MHYPFGFLDCMLVGCFCIKNNQLCWGMIAVLCFVFKPLFFFSGKKYFLYDPEIGNSTSPESLEEDWVGVKLPITAALSLKNEMYLIGKKKFQKILMLTYSQNRVYGNIHQAKKLDLLLVCESPKQ